MHGGVPQLASSAYARPPDASTSLTGPGVVICLQVRPPSCVAHSCGSKAQPSDAVANRTFVIAGLAPVNAAGTVPTLVHVLPASREVASVAHEPETQPCPHAAPVHTCAPSTNPWVAETNVTEAGRNPASDAGAAVGVDTTVEVGDGPADEGDPPAADDTAAEVAGVTAGAGDEFAADETGAVPVGVV